MFNLIDADETLKLDNQFCFAIYALSRKVTGLYRPLLKPLGLTYPQYLVLLVLWEEHSNSPEQGVNIKLLCERLMLDTGTLTPLLKRMEGQGIISRNRSVIDEREVLVVLTEDGIALKEKAKHIPMTLMCESNLPVDRVGPLLQELKQLLCVIE